MENKWRTERKEKSRLKTSYEKLEKEQPNYTFLRLKKYELNSGCPFFVFK